MLSVTMWEGRLVKGVGGGGKWVGLSAKALVGFGLLSGGDSRHPQTLTNVIPWCNDDFVLYNMLTVYLMVIFYNQTRAARSLQSLGRLPPW